METILLKPCPTCKRLGRTCVLCAAEAERAKHAAGLGRINPLTRIERDKLAQAEASAS